MSDTLPVFLPRTVLTSAQLQALVQAVSGKLDQSALSNPGGLTLPAGSTGQRASSPPVGTVRVNTDTNVLEVYLAPPAGWTALGAAGTGTGTGGDTGGTGTGGGGTPPPTAPNPPTGLAAGTASSSAVPLTWKASTTAGCTYLVQYRASGTGFWTTWGAAQTGLSVTVAGLQPATAYDFMVDAVSSAGLVAQSAIVSASTVGVAPGQVTGVTAGAISSTTIALSWTAPSVGTPPISYTVRYRPQGTLPYSNSAPQSGTTYTITGLSPNTTYEVLVLAANTNPAQSTSVTVLGTTLAPAATAPNAPTGLAASSVTDTGFTLTWVASSAGTTPISYTVLYSLNGFLTSTLAGTTQGTTIAIGGLSSGQTYQVKVGATNSAGSANSNPLSVPLPTPAPVPGSVSGTQNSGTALPIVYGPASGSVSTGSVLAITGCSTSDPPAAGNPGDCALDVWCTSGTITMTDASGTPISGSGTNRIWAYAAPLAGVNAALATLTYTPPTAAGSDTISVWVWDQFQGPNSQINIPITITAGSGTGGGTGGTGGGSGGGGSGGGTGGGTSGGALPTDATGTQAAPAQKFVKSFGMNMHIGTIKDGFTVDAYNNIDNGQYSQVIGCLTYMHCFTIRDTAYAKNQTGIAYWPRIWKDTGAQYIAVVPGNVAASEAQDALNLYHSVLVQNSGIYVAYDGMNEPDAEGYSPGAGDAFQPTVFNQARADGIKAIDWSYGNPGDWGTGGNMSAYCDYANAHVYFNPHMRGPDSGGITDYVITRVTTGASGKPVAITEWGYETPYAGDGGSVSNYAQAVYVLQAIIAFYARGCPWYTYYALFDDGSGNWGLFNSDYSPRQSATAIRNLFGVMLDTSAGSDSISCGKLNYTLGGAWSQITGQEPMGGKSALLQHSDGRFFLVLSNNQDVTSEGGADMAVPANVSITINLGTAATTVNFYDPMRGSTAVNTWSATSSVTVSLPPHPCVVEIIRP